MGNTNVKLTVKVLTTISINNAELQVKTLYCFLMQNYFFGKEQHEAMYKANNFFSLFKKK